MNASSKSLIWIGSQIYRNWKQFLTGITGIFSGAIFILYMNYFFPVPYDSLGSFVWQILLSSLSWIFLRFFLKHNYLLYVSIVYHLGDVIYGLSPSYVVSELTDFFFLTSFLFVTMSVTEHFLFSQHTRRYVVITFIALLFSYQILPAIVPNFNMSHLHLFIMSILIVLVISSITVIVSELIILGLQELFGKVRYLEKRQ